jgi:hypothetical protein
MAALHCCRRRSAVVKDAALDTGDGSAFGGGGGMEEFNPDTAGLSRLQLIAVVLGLVVVSVVAATMSQSQLHEADEELLNKRLQRLHNIEAFEAVQEHLTQSTCWAWAKRLGQSVLVCGCAAHQPAALLCVDFLARYFF